MKKVVTIILALCLGVAIMAIHPASAKNYDINGDGKVNIVDVTELQRFIAEVGSPATSSTSVRIEDVASKYKTAEARFINVLLSEEVCDGQGFMIVDSHDLTEDMINNRTKHDVLLIERVIGVVEDDNGEGRVLNTTEDKNISYAYIYEHYRVGTVVCTYFVYNPCTTGEDIVNRYDYVIDRSHEEVL